MRLLAVVNRGEVCSNMTAIFGAVLLLLGGTAALAQAPASAHPAQHAVTNTDSQNKQEADQITELRAQVARLQAAVQQLGSGKRPSVRSGTLTSTAGTGGGMGAMASPGKVPMPSGEGDMGAMAPSGNAAMPSGEGDMDAMAPPANAAMPPGGRSMSAPAGAMGMCCMGEMGMAGGASGGMSGMGGAAPPGGAMAPMNAPSSAMPGQPGASHLYHIGSTGFFLNYSQHITLTADQRFALNRLKEKTMLDRASEQRRIDQAEQELYTLTGADQLDNSRVQAKIGEIERLRAEQRMNFIRAVGEAINVLTHDQHQALMGTMAPSKK